MLKPNQARDDAAQPGLGSGSALHAGLFIMHQAVRTRQAFGLLLLLLLLGLTVT